MEYSQTGRPIRLDTPLGEDKLLLEDFEGSEGVSQQFSFHLRAVSADNALPLESLLNQQVVVSLRTNFDEPRYFTGVVSRATQLERTQGLTTYQLEVAPWSWFLSLIMDCRIFHDKTVPQIVEAVFGDPGLPAFVSYRFQLSGTYQPRAYCVQYRETDLSFVSRLLEEEGIFYYFEHTSEKHTMVLCDDSSTLVPCPGDPVIPYNASAEASQDDDVIQTIGRHFEVCSRTITLTDFDFKNPSAVDLLVKASIDNYELYDYPGRYYVPDLGKQYAAIRLEEQEVRRVMVDGSSNCRHLVPGTTFQLNDLTGVLPQTGYSILSLQHSAGTNSYRSEGAAAFSYENSFQAIPDSVKFRPPRVAQKTVVRGSQTAIVVGDAGKEIDVDEFGRVKVHFHWDRLSQISCRVRVSQSWAGKTWGAIEIPRIGQEVVVDFLEGDPDRPLIVGRVYNAEQMPPYTLPANQTISGTKSRSSENGDGTNYNEFVFEDKKGSEYIRMHAERDMREYVEQDSYEFVGQDRHMVVTGTQAEKVGGDKHVTVEGEVRQSIGGSLSLKVANNENKKVGNVYTIEGGSEIHIKGGMKVIIEAGMELSLVGAGGFIDIGPAGVAIQGTMVLINSGGSAGSGTASQPEEPLDPKVAPEA